MAYGKRFGPGDGYSVRKGERSSDEDDVAGHGFVPRASDEAGGTGRTARPIPADDDDDVEGHRFEARNTQQIELEG